MIDQTTYPTQPESSTNTSNLKYIGVFIVLLLLVGVAGVFGWRVWQGKQSSESIIQENNLPKLLTDCKFFHQICPTSSEGIATKDTVQTILNFRQSPLLSIFEVPYFLPSGEETDPVPPQFVISYLAAENNINPFLLMAISELRTKSISQNPELETPVDPDGEEVGFFKQYKQLAMNLSQRAVTIGLTPNALDQFSQVDSVEFFGKTYQVLPNTPTASLLLTQYLADEASSQDQFEEWLQAFPVIYEQIAGLNPTSDEFAPDDRLSR